MSLPKSRMKRGRNNADSDNAPAPLFAHSFSSFLRVERRDHGDIDAEVRAVVPSLLVEGVDGHPRLRVQALVAVIRQCPPDSTDDTKRRTRRLLINLPYVLLYQLHCHLLHCRDPSCALPSLHSLDWSSVLDMCVLNECMKREELQLRRRKLMSLPSQAASAHTPVDTRVPRWWLHADDIGLLWSRWHEVQGDGALPPAESYFAERISIPAMLCEFDPCVHLDMDHYQRRAHPELRAPMQRCGDTIAMKTDLRRAPAFRDRVHQQHIDIGVGSQHDLRLAVYPHDEQLHPSFRQRNLTAAERRHPFVNHRAFVPAENEGDEPIDNNGTATLRSQYKRDGIVDPVAFLRGFPFEEGAPSAQLTLARFRRNLHAFLGFDPEILLLNTGCQLMGGAVLTCAMPLHSSLLRYHRAVERYEQLFRHQKLAVLPTAIVSAILAFCAEYQDAYRLCVTTIGKYYRSDASGVSESDADIFVCSQLQSQREYHRGDSATSSQKGTVVEDEQLRNLLDNRIQHVVASVHARIGSHRYPYVVRSKTALTLCGTGIFRNLQFIPVIGRGPLDVLTDFDVDCASFAYDGQQVWCLPRAQSALNTRCNLTSPFLLRYHRFRARIAKYLLRSFDTMVFESCKHEPRCDQVLDTDVYLMFCKLLVTARVLKDKTEAANRSRHARQPWFDPTKSEMYEDEDEEEQTHRMKSQRRTAQRTKEVLSDRDNESDEEMAMGDSRAYNNGDSKEMDPAAPEPDIAAIRQHYGGHRLVHAQLGTVDNSALSFTSSLLIQQQCSDCDEQEKLKRHDWIFSPTTSALDTAGGESDAATAAALTDPAKRRKLQTAVALPTVIGGGHTTVADLFDNDKLIYQDDVVNFIPTFAPNAEYLRKFFAVREAEEYATRTTPRFAHGHACHLPQVMATAVDYDQRRNQTARPGTALATPSPAVAAAGTDAAAHIGVDASRVSHFCYMCRQLTDGEYGDVICQRCATTNQRYRDLMSRASLTGAVCIVTGARIKIGYATALQLLRSGATVVATTRFAYLALARYQNESDSAMWLDRLHVCAMDLRNIAAIHAFSEDIKRQFGRVDVLINNAAQTVKKSREYEAFWTNKERQCQHLYLQDKDDGPSLPSTHSSPSVSAPRHHPMPVFDIATSLQRPTFVSLTNAPRTFTALGAGGDASIAELREVVGVAQDSDGIDLRAVNSWCATLSDVDNQELLEVTAINQLAPFLLVQSLTPLMSTQMPAGPAAVSDSEAAASALTSLAAASGSAVTEELPLSGAFVINVTSPEGSFSHSGRASDIHPHTNMCKAALNQLTVTSAPMLAAKRIYLVAVDPGWCSEQRTLPRVMQHPIKIPLSYQDGAARVLQPIVEWKQQCEAKRESPAVTPPATGQLLKDFQCAAW